VTVGAVLAVIFTGGLASGLLVPAITLIGASITFAASGVSQISIKKTYEEAYGEGLKDCIDDLDTAANLEGANPEDDEIQWFHDHLSSVFFESTVNMNHRVEPNFGAKMFMNSPTHYSELSIASYNIDKVSSADTVNGGRTYSGGLALAEIYKVNKDYKRVNKEKLFFPIGKEYDCCSDCVEEFPNRIHWSEQSFQEELSDNFKSFLANNYRDIEGGTGKVSDLFKIQNNLYIHSQEGLWHLPQNIQERITGDVTSFIGTGEYFSIPPRRIVDDATGMSAGSEHKWATIKTPHGVFFVCEKQKIIYKFDGNSLKPISSNGMFNWHKENTGVKMDEFYKQQQSRDYPYKNNPSNPFGTGFISVYDARKERIIFTKKDYLFADTVMGERNDYDYEVFYKGGDLYLHADYATQVEDFTEAGYSFLGINNLGQMVFQKYNPETGEIDEEKINATRKISESEIFNNSWTLSYSLKTNSWVSFHSYMPNIYYSTPDKFYSWESVFSIFGIVDNPIWLHNVDAKYQTYYGTLYPHIIEYVSLSNALATRTWESIKLLTEAKKHNVALDQFVDERYITYNKAIFYNSRQASGEMELIPKDTQANPVDYMMQQVEDNTPTQILLDRNERDWSLNELRDLRIDYNNPIFNSSNEDLQINYYIDKMLNLSTIDYEKDWTELEYFRDKYLVVRLIFDNFDDIKLLLNYSIENEIISPR